MKIALKELRETMTWMTWLKIIARKRLGRCSGCSLSRRLTGQAQVIL
jgi:hypothetical protein